MNHQYTYTILTYMRCIIIDTFDFYNTIYIYIQHIYIYIYIPWKQITRKTWSLIYTFQVGLFIDLGFSVNIN